VSGLGQQMVWHGWSMPGQRSLLCLTSEIDCAETAFWQESTTCSRCGWLAGGPAHSVQPDEPPVTSNLPAPSPSLSALSPAPMTYQCQATVHFFVCFSVAASVNVDIQKGHVAWSVVC